MVAPFNHAYEFVYTFNRSVRVTDVPGEPSSLASAAGSTALHTSIELLLSVSSIGIRKCWGSHHPSTVGRAREG
jgi:hypothetical protein